MEENEPRATLAELAEELKLGLIGHATGQAMDETRFKELRKNLLGVRSIRESIPRYIRVCRSLDEFWGFISSEHSTYKERRAYLAETLNPIIEVLEGEETTLEDHFVEGELIGRGGFGSVYKVHHQLLDIDFALKIFRPAFDDGNPRDLDRFFREARVLFQLSHSNIIRVFDVGFVRSMPFIRMEYFPGLNLDAAMANHGCFPPDKAKALVCGILSGLQYAHDEAHIVHRDIKPSNIMIARGEKVKIVDFGLSVFIEEDIVSRITQTGESAVSGYYAEPELLANPRDLDPRADLYSVGAIWYCVLLGTPPAGSDVSNTLRNSISVSKEYCDVLLKSLNPRANRFTSAREMLVAVEALVN